VDAATRPWPRPWCRPLTSRRSTGCSPTKSLRCAHLPTTRRHLRSLTSQLGRHCTSSVRCRRHHLLSPTTSWQKLCRRPNTNFRAFIDLIAELFNHSLATGHFLGRFKDAFITPIVKKAGLDPNDVYGPISNLPVGLLPKLLERLVPQRLMNYVWHLSTFCHLCSLVSVLDIPLKPPSYICCLISYCMVVDRGDFPAQVLLDLSAAFDTVDHDVFLQRLQASYARCKRFSLTLLCPIFTVSFALDFSAFFTLCNSSTRGHQMKLMEQFNRVNSRAFCISNRCIDAWNSLK